MDCTKTVLRHPRLAVLAASRLRFASAVHNRIQGRSCRSTVGYNPVTTSSRLWYPTSEPALAYVGNVMLRAIEICDFEERMSKLENMLSAGETGGT